MGGITIHEGGYRAKKMHWEKYKKSGAHRYFHLNSKYRKNADVIRKKGIVAYENRLTPTARGNPEAYYGYVQSEKTLHVAAESLSSGGSIAKTDREKSNVLKITSNGYTGLIMEFQTTSTPLIRWSFLKYLK